MKRGGELKRKSPLRFGCRPLPTFSRRRRAERPERDAVREAVLARDGYRCRMSDGTWQHHTRPARHGPLTVHHLQKASACGPYVATNLICLCAGHNGLIEDYPELFGLMGLVQRRGDTVEDVWEALYYSGLSSSPEPGSAP